MNTSEKQKEVLNLIRSEQLKVCDVLETTLKMKKLHNVCDKMFHGWEWVSNMQECNKGCKIMVGWENNETNVHVLNKTSQSLFCVISSEKPWCIVGDMNVTLHPNKHSYGSSTMTADMMEFQDCLNEIEVEDICKSSLHFTWTKNLHKTKAGIMSGILKKLDRNVMFDIDDSKAPEPDGFTTTFFKKAWDIVGSDVCRAFRTSIKSAATKVHSSWENIKTTHANIGDYKRKRIFEKRTKTKPKMDKTEHGNEKSMSKSQSPSQIEVRQSQSQLREAESEKHNFEGPIMPNPKDVNQG
ncbi:RNA-directed DNA polymerase, eukaryota, reverse transcriptase zinc-binding domain protein [Tanacetum coccineum]